MLLGRSDEASPAELVGPQRDDFARKPSALGAVRQSVIKLTALLAGGVRMQVRLQEDDEQIHISDGYASSFKGMNIHLS